jgi:hypothetical protein
MGDALALFTACSSSSQSVSTKERALGCQDASPQTLHVPRVQVGACANHEEPECLGRETESGPQNVNTRGRGSEWKGRAECNMLLGSSLAIFFRDVAHMDEDGRARTQLDSAVPLTSTCTSCMATLGPGRRLLLHPYLELKENQACFFEKGGAYRVQASADVHLLLLYQLHIFISSPFSFQLQFVYTFSSPFSAITRIERVWGAVSKVHHFDDLVRLMHSRQRRSR